MSVNTRKVMLILTLAGFAGVVILAPASEGPEALPLLSAPISDRRVMDLTVQRAADKGGIGAASNRLPARGALGDAKADPFAPRSWRPPPKAVAAPLAAPLAAPPIPPAPPAPPPMVYRFAGRLVQDGKLQIFVSKGDTPVVVKVGDMLEGGYVVQAMTTATIELINPDFGNRVDIVIPQVISTDSAKARAGLTAAPNSPASYPLAPSMQNQPDIAVPFNPASRMR